DLTFEVLLRVGDVIEEPQYRRFVADQLLRRGQGPADTVPCRGQPFCCITYELYRRTGRDEFRESFIRESLQWAREAQFDSEGLLVHVGRDGRGALVDYLQEYAGRMARTAYLLTSADGRKATESPDVRPGQLFDYAVGQYRAYRSVLRDPETGLWSQGRGWLPGDSRALSPGAWSRGHGWLMRGLVGVLEHVPDRSSWRREAVALLRELADTLAAVQSHQGMWHQLLHRPLDESFPETSGTGMIAWALAVGVSKGWLARDVYEPVVCRAAGALCGCVDGDGVVYHGCVGPGPLRSEEGYLGVDGPPDEPHGIPGAMLGLIAPALLRPRPEGSWDSLFD
ncbi:MAG: hypothetical protein GF331_18380, partial [Chitinivibrionales bacterium]|nr:hypothetical protein [Chitinivibrionales bacterium]